MERDKQNKPLKSLSEKGTEFMPLTSSTHLYWHGFSIERFRLHNIETTTAAYSNYATLTALGGSGKIRCRSSGKSFCTNLHQKNDILIAPPGFSTTGFDHQQLDGVIVHFEPSFIENASRDLVFAGKIELVPQPFVNDEFITMMNGFLLNEAANGNPSGSLYAESIATAYAIHLLKNYSVFPLPAKRDYNNGLNASQMRRLLEYIEANLAENLTIRELARMLDLSPYRLFRAFKVSTGQTLHTFVLRKRIEKARRLLVQTDLSLSEIAYTAGFSSQSHFTQIFRQAVKSTPQKYRNNIRG